MKKKLCSLYGFSPGSTQSSCGLGGGAGYDTYMGTCTNKLHIYMMTCTKTLIIYIRVFCLNHMFLIALFGSFAGIIQAQDYSFWWIL